MTMHPATDPEERRKGIGASDMPVLALGEYFGKTPQDLWAEKCGLAEPENLDDNPHVRRGIVMEDIAAQEFTRKTGLKLRRRTQTLTHPNHSFLMAHLDRVITGDGTPVEIKCPSSYQYRKMKRHGIDQGYQVQGQQQALILRKAGVVFWIFSADLWEGFWVNVEADQAIQGSLIDLGKDFWRHVETRTPPPAATPIELPPPEGVDQTQIITRDNPEWIGAVAKLREARTIRDEAAEYEAACVADIKALMGGPGRWIKAPTGDRMDWSIVKGRKTFNWKGLAAAHPDLDLEPYFKTGQPSERFQARWAKED
jgi:putative phage-type endonuclease